MTRKASLFHAALPILLAALALQGCVAASPPKPFALAAAPNPGPNPTITSFAAVASRVEPVAEALCRRQQGPRNCDITIAVDDRPGLTPNAYQTVDRRGRPFVIFTQSLIALARNDDELAFVIGHEAAHHIAGHIPRRQDQARSGATLAGAIAQSTGATAAEVAKAQEIGAEAGARQYARQFELEADALGAEIAFAAGFSPVRGAAFFDRLPDPGQAFLGTHPPNAQRKALVTAITRRLQDG